MANPRKKKLVDRTFTFKEIVLAMVIPTILTLISVFLPQLFKSEPLTVNNITTQNNYYSRLAGSNPASPDFQRIVTQNDLNIINGIAKKSDTVTIWSLYESDCRECYTYANEMMEKLKESGYDHVSVVPYKYESYNSPKYNGSFWIGKGDGRTFIYITRIKS